MQVYTDGACQNNGRKGSLAGVGVWFGDDHPLNYSAPLSSPPHTNQRAELEAILIALQRIEMIGGSGVIYTDSQYSIDCLTKWCKGWRRNGWQTAQKKPVLNQDLIRAALALLERLPVRLEKVAGHSGNYGNDQADALAVAGTGSVQKNCLTI